MKGNLSVGLITVKSPSVPCRVSLSLGLFDCLVSPEHSTPRRHTIPTPRKGPVVLACVTHNVRTDSRQIRKFTYVDKTKENFRGPVYMIVKSNTIPFSSGRVMCMCVYECTRYVYVSFFWLL